jgi:hypothetical protein
MKFDESASSLSREQNYRRIYERILAGDTWILIIGAEQVETGVLDLIEEEFDSEDFQVILSVPAVIVFADKAKMKFKDLMRLLRVPERYQNEDNPVIVAGPGSQPPSRELIWFMSMLEAFVSVNESKRKGDPMLCMFDVITSGAKETGGPAAQLAEPEPCSHEVEGIIGAVADYVDWDHQDSIVIGLCRKHYHRLTDLSGSDEKRLPFFETDVMT